MAGKEPKSGSLEAVQPMRLNRYIARAGVCSRRKADELIASGRVHVNGSVVTELGTRVEPSDVVVVNGMRISPARHTTIVLNKPRGVITTTSDERGRRNVLDLVKLPGKSSAGLFPVGRLDRDTTGVLLVTNDGELANRLMHPRYEIEKLYVVEADRPVDPEDIGRLKSGIVLEETTVRADEAAFRSEADPRVIGISIHEGRNRQIRRMMESLGYHVLRLDRIRYAGITANRIRRGRWRRLTSGETARLYRMVGLKTY